MRTIETTIYEFDELSDKAKAKALDKCRDWSVDHGWWEYLLEDRAEQWVEKGYYVRPPNINVSGFHSQGDGACFKGTFDFSHEQCLALLPCDLADRITLHNTKCRLHGADELALKITGTIVTSGRSSHSGSMSVGDLNVQPEMWHRCNLGPCDCVPSWLGICDEFEDVEKYFCDDAVPYIEEAIKEEARGLADELYSDLRAEYEYRTGDEHVAEMIRANEREFDAEGNLV